MLHTCVAKENDTAIRHSGWGGGSCYICSVAVNCGLEKRSTLAALNALVMS